MKKLALVLLALALPIWGCGSSPNTSTNNTSTEANGNWEAQLTGGTDQAALLNFVTTFSVTNTGPLNVTGFAFFNSGACFTTGDNAETVNGSADFTTSSTNTVTGTLNLTITSSTNGSVLTLSPGVLTGNSNGTTTTTGTLSNGVVVGSWSLTPGSGATGCNAGTGTYILCQGKATCTPTAASAATLRKSE
ncbi:MAG TPA: hypothetical protein VMU05_22325 [Dongiaceae bacterium]|nr:hypothetical protein [Dongiaceae bacterium]